MVTTETCPSSLEKGQDWIRDTTLEDLRNGLVRRWTHQKPMKAWEIDWLFEKVTGPSQARDNILPANKGLSLSLSPSNMQLSICLCIFFP